jgi:hypothetical protein
MERRYEATLEELVAAVIDVVDDESDVTEVVVQMLRSGAVRLGRRAPNDGLSW